MPETTWAKMQHARMMLDEARDAADRARENYILAREAFLKTPEGRAAQALDYAKTWTRLWEESGKAEHRAKAEAHYATVVAILGSTEQPGGNQVDAAGGRA